MRSSKKSTTNNSRITEKEFIRLQGVASKSLPTDSPQVAKSTSKLELTYDITMLIIIVIDLAIIGIDLVLMSNFANQMANWLGVTHHLTYYTQEIHIPLRILGSFFTIFLITELAIRWLLSILKKEYMRWFFFPFVHWYEVLGCFPQLRALRLLRALFIGRKLYQMGYQVLPEKWIATGKFYYGLILEELSDRVILTATGNLRHQLAGGDTRQRLMEKTLNKNRPAIQAMISSMLKQELVPKLKQVAHGPVAQELSSHVGASVHDALANTPELRRYLRMIPIAGKLIENELHAIGEHVGENLVSSLTYRLTQTETLDSLIDAIAEAISEIDLHNSELELLITNIVDDSLNAFEEQVKVQQWKHQQFLHL